MNETNFGFSQLAEHTPPIVKKCIYALLVIATIYGVVIVNAPDLIPASIQHYAAALIPALTFIGNMFGIKKPEQAAQQ